MFPAPGVAGGSLGQQVGGQDPGMNVQCPLRVQRKAVEAFQFPQVLQVLVVDNNKLVDNNL